MIASFQWNLAQSDLDERGEFTISMMSKEEMQVFSKLFSQYCRQEINRGHCEPDCCDLCPINSAYGVINKKKVSDLLSNHRKAVNIQWDIDPEDMDSVELPTEIDIPEEIQDEEAISDYISEVTGFCHKGFELEEQL